MRFDLNAWADLYVATLYTLALNDFGLFRQLIHPNILWSWWLDEVARELTKFSRDLVEGRRPILALMAPPQHGKSWTVWDFIGWMAGKFPDLKTIYASYSDELGTAANRHLFRTISSSDAFHKIFPDLRVGAAGWSANSSVLEFVDQHGSFRNTTVNGAVNGFGLNLGVIDDPVKGSAEANSKDQRDKTWAWFTDDFFERFAEKSGLLIIMTRWHVDDLLGRMLERIGDVRVLRYPAIAETTSWRWRKELLFDRDSRCRFGWQKQLVRKGEALFPEHKTLLFLEERRKVMTQASWEALYQQHPIIVGGGELPIEKLRVLPSWDRANNIVQSVRYIDKAGTAEGGSYTAGVLMHKMNDKTYVISHIMRGQWSALEREQKIKATVATDAKYFNNYQVVVEQEPGSGGKESVEHTIRNLAGYRVYADKVTGSKEARAQPFAAQVQAGNVWLHAGAWVQAFLDECEMWPKGKFSDQVDAAVGAFSKLATSSSYDCSYAGFQDVNWRGILTNWYLQTGAGTRPW